MPNPIHEWRVNPKHMEPCCYSSLWAEMARRGDAKEELLCDGDVLKCEKCETEMVCDPSQNDGRLRWRVK